MAIQMTAYRFKVALCAVIVLSVMVIVLIAVPINNYLSPYTVTTNTVINFGDYNATLTKNINPYLISCDQLNNLVMNQRALVIYDQNNTFSIGPGKIAIDVGLLEYYTNIYDIRMYYQYALQANLGCPYP